MNTLHRLDTNKLYHIGSLVLDCWVGPAERRGDGDGGTCWSYFDADGRYLGPDQHGIEPVFTRDSTAISLIAVVLRAAGERFAGNDVTEMATDWYDHDFDASEVSDWCDIGCWNPSVAAQWRDAGLTPAIVTTAAEALLASLPEECDPADVYTDGCPIYSCCNEDTDPEVVLQICRDVVREFDKLTLCEWADSKEHVMVYVMGTAYPTGTTAPYGNPDMDWLDRIGVDKLHGTVNEHGAWQWDGEGHPRDERGNSILNVTAYIDQKGWESAVAEYNAEV